ncbi:MAG TPA: PepSY domain-containing protein [Gammaproteobacteria bacterium]|nr:PepSY domain-containing protein [Gammaproteobacteria bacterium]
MHDNAAEQSPRRALRGGRLGTVLFCALCLLGGAGPVIAERGGQPPRPMLQLAQAEEKISLSQATRMVRERTGGQVLRAETKRNKGRTVHRIRVLTEEGRVRTWHVDAQTGRVY